MSSELLKQHIASLNAIKEKNATQPKKPQPHFTPVAREESPLFEPEGSPIQQSPQLPVADMVAPASTSTPVPAYDPSIPEAPSFLKQLQDIEVTAKEEMAAWDPSFLPQASDPVLGASQTPVKRKFAELDSDSSDGENEDETDSDEEEEGVPPHDPNSQIRPRLPIYHPGFQLAEKMTRKVLETFTQFIATSIRDGYRDEEAVRLRNEIIKKKTINYQDAVRLAVAGDTGVGKSALLNALLGVLNLTIESDSGGACTCVITEFRQSNPTQSTPYAAEVKFFCLEVCRNLVKCMFSQWYNVKAKQRENPDDVDDLELSQMSTARDCLQELFADRLEYGTAEMFMGTATSADDPKILHQLTKWTSEIHQQFIRDGETSVYFGASTPEELTEQYHPFTRSVPNASYDGKPLKFTPWPLVEVVQVSLASPILAQNIIIADVPGVSDVNYFRVQNAADYLQKCSTTIVVGKIDRLQDNASFRQQYLEAYRRRRSGSVILVATRSDDLNDENGSTLVLDSSTESLMTTINEKLLSTEKKIQLTVNEIERKVNKESKANRKALRKQKKKFVSRKNALEKLRKSVRIAHRSKQVGRIIGMNYRSDTGDDAGAPVFCVSNRMYMRHLRGYDTDNVQSIPTMAIEETQIPALISHIFAMPSKGRTATLDHFVRVSIQTLLSVIQMSCSTSTLTRVKHLVETVQRARDDLNASINDLATKFIKTDIKSLENELAHHNLQSRFDTRATAQLRIWEKLPAATHKAVCNKQGTHVLKKRGINLHWNEDLMSPMRPAIDQIFRTVLDESCDKFQAQAAQTIKDALNDLDNMLRGDPQALAADAYKMCLEDNKIRYVEEISRQIVTAGKTLKDGLIKVHMRAVRVGEEDYFYEAMLNIYAEAKEVKGTGKGMTMMAARCKYLEDAIPGPTGPFNSISGWVEEDASKVMKEVKENLKNEADEVFLQIQSNFNAMRRRKENDTPEGKKFRTELHELVAEARRIMDGVGTEALDACKLYK